MTILKILLGLIALFIAISAGVALSNGGQAGGDAAALLAVVAVIIGISSTKL